jgi:two-component system response regulator
VKPVDFEQFVRVIQSITDYWFTVVVLPPKPA